MSFSASAIQLTKPKSGGLLLLRRRAPLTRRTVAYFCSGAHILGPFAVNTSFFIGYRLFGVIGGLLSASAFLAPSVALVILLSHLYFRYHSIPALQGAVSGLGPVVIALILMAGWSIGRKVVRSWPEALIAIGALAAGVAKLNTVWVLATAAGIADVLLQTPSVPFRIGHHFASNLTDYARSHGLTLGQIPYTEAVRIYKADTKQDFPLTEAQFKEAISAEYMVYSRKGVGGPQLPEVKRMPADEHAHVKADFDWLKVQREHLAGAEASLDKAVATLAGAAVGGKVANR